MTLITKCQERSSHYVAVLNGRWYRIDGEKNSSEEFFRSDPLDLQPPPAAAPAAGLDPAKTASLYVSTVGPVPESEAAPEIVSKKRYRPRIKIEDASSEMQQNGVRPFSRDGSDSLRAGHPDLWNLLVAGTCLEGSVFQRA